MFNFALKSRVRVLENLVNKMLQEKACEKGLHEWEMTTSAFHNKPPFIRCKYCYAAPTTESKGE